MTVRYKIEDIISQSTEGILFRAVDAENDVIVMIYRFFPFGLNGGGLPEEQKKAYNLFIKKLTDVRHPALRTVVAGGCDPIDGIPYLVTEWIDGEFVSEISRHGRLSIDIANDSIIGALEVSELLSQRLAEEGIWVETDFRTMIVGAEDSGRRMTFCVSPLKWLSGNKPSRNLDSIIDLAECMMVNKGRIVRDPSTRGLSAWVHWLRTTAPANISLRKAHQMLASFLGEIPAPPVKHQPIQPISVPIESTAPILPTETPNKRSSNIRWVVGILGCLIVVGWIGVVRLSSPKNTATTIESVIEWNRRDLLITNGKKPVTIEGTVMAVVPSDSKKTVYLLFAEPTNKTAARVGFEVKDNNSDAILKALNVFIGEKIQATGKIKIRKAKASRRPEVMIESILSIKIIR